MLSVTRYCLNSSLKPQGPLRGLCFIASTSDSVRWLEGKRGLSTRASTIVRKMTASNLVATAPDSWKPYLKLMRVDKPIGTWLLYWPCTWSIALATPAGHLPSLYMLGLFGTGAFLMRSAGCVINDLWDRDFDKKVERTKSRPLASGQISPAQAVMLLGGLLSASLGILLQLNWTSVAVGATSMLLVVSYPLAKRYTFWPQLVLGCTFNYGVPVGYTAIAVSSLREFATIAVPIVLPLYAAGVFWTLIYDTIYAHQDKTDDMLIGVKSTALLFGDSTRFWLGGFSAAMLTNLLLVGWMAEQTWPYYVALGGTAAQLAWQVGTVRINNPQDCWRKFSSNLWLGALLFVGIAMGNLLKKTKVEAKEQRGAEERSN